MTPDTINAAFELGGAVLIWANVRALYRAKEVRGVYAPVMAFYAAWGLWNVFYYPAIGQTLSFWAGLGVVAGNVAWCALAWRYHRRAQLLARIEARLRAGPYGGSL